MLKHIIIAILIVILSQSIAFSETATGIVSNIQFSTGDTVTIYFKIDPMPTGVTNFFYIRDDGLLINSKMLDRTLSLLLASQISKSNFTTYYSLESGGYGKVNVSPGGVILGN